MVRAPWPHCSLADGSAWQEGGKSRLQWQGAPRESRTGLAGLYKQPDLESWAQWRTPVVPAAGRWQQRTRDSKAPLACQLLLLRARPRQTEIHQNPNPRRAHPARARTVLLYWGHDHGLVSYTRAKGCLLEDRVCVCGPGWPQTHRDLIAYAR